MTTSNSLNRNQFSNQRSPAVGRLATSLLVLPAAALLLTPFGIVAAAAAEQPDMLKVLVEKPLVAVQLAAALVMSLLFCGLPFVRLATPPVQVRCVTDGPQTAPIGYPTGRSSPRDPTPDCRLNDR
jgi:hypothetical protein